MGQQNLIIFLLLMDYSLCSASDVSIPDDSTAMAILAGVLNPMHPSWSQSSTNCQWPNVDCDAIYHVVKINLRGMSLTQFLLPEFPNLPRLKILDL
ncbi:hypothetical protein SLEP1_g29440 [Rubroshorea leprosula]|uniref:Leucine-rich repeat-containing N-terminal plant-type domain-containing protein n=1 Tax=Rubroshorea leprosula TaxID=152421 RepID=A0AAV5K605_9ROSI|nr:hypothetical protein SLEP1_g29440 [Rubroshorea leprosula]